MGARVYTPEMLADEWGCTVKTIRSLIDQGRLKAFKAGERMVRIRADDAEAFIRDDGNIPRPRDYSSHRVYFIACGEFVKIGVAGDVEARLQALATMSPFDMKLLASEPGHFPKEKELHRRFASYHHRDEWFRLSPEIQAYIDELRSGDGS